jgi:hypothetical protein
MLMENVYKIIAKLYTLKLRSVEMVSQVKTFSKIL